MIIHKVDNPAGWTAHPNAIWEDQHISWRAKGLLGYLLSRPPGWRTDGKRLAAAGVEGRDAVYKALSELERRGYLHRPRKQGAAGTWATEVYVYDHPQQHLIAAQLRSPQLVEKSVDNPGDELGRTAPPTPENPDPENQDSLVTTKTKKISTSQPDHRGHHAAPGDKSARPSGPHKSDAAEGGALPAASPAGGGAEKADELALDDSDLAAIRSMAELEPGLPLFALRAHLREALDDDSIDFAACRRWLLQARDAQGPRTVRKTLTVRDVIGAAIDDPLTSSAPFGSTAEGEDDELPLDAS